MSEQIDPAVAHLDRFYHRQVDRIVAQLRDMAEEIEHRGHEVFTSRADMKPDYARSATSVVHKVQNGMGNLPLDSLLSAATEVDREVRKPEVSDVEG